MRSFLLLVLATAATQVFAFDLECERQVTNNHYTYANIDIYPDVFAEVGDKKCTGDNVKFCVGTSREIVSDYDRMCGYRVYPRECRTSEWRDARGNRYIETYCRRIDAGVLVTLGASGQHTLSCFRGNRTTALWRLGRCRYGH